MSFVDQVRIRVSAGAGGRGSASFARSKNVPRGRPDGGDGGNGGSVGLQATHAVASLAHLVRARRHRAAGGEPGGPNRRQGGDGDDVTVTVPVGTVVREAASGEVLADLARDDDRFVAAKGGRGGRGNASLRGGHDRAPNYAETGEDGQDADLILELHLVADVGLLGPPNAGKSTLLGAVSRARPKIADYPFTTIDPGLGVVDVGGDRFVLADLPGLIRGAAHGKGLGLRFLRHAERCSVLAAMVDLAGPDPAGELEAVVAEVEAYDADLVTRLRVVIGNKTDLGGADVRGAADRAASLGARFIAISATQGSNLTELVDVLAEEVERSRAELGRPQTFMVFRPVAPDRVVVQREDGCFRVTSTRAERAIAQTPLDNPRAVRRLQRRLRALGVEAALRREGAEEGDEVRIGDVSFEFYPDDSEVWRPDA